MEINGAFATVNQYGGVDYAQMNAGVTPAFFIEAVKDDAASEREGRAIFREIERVALIIAGDPNTRPVHPITPEILARFGDQYKRWKENREPLISGTPLAQWPPMTPAKRLEFEALGIKSVEDLAAWADYAIGKMHDGRQWRDKAKAWLSQAAGSADIMRLTAENDRLKEKVEELMKAVEELRVEAAKPSKDEAPRQPQQQNDRRR